MPQKYSPEFKARALKLIEERVRAEQCSGWVACTAVGEALGGISPHTLRNWWKQDRIDQGEAPGLNTAEAEEITKLRRENLELRRANEILRKASAFFAAELDRPTTR
jgi:transposase